jgi:NADH-quinone oxidoreductase subunit K
MLNLFEKILTIKIMLSSTVSTTLLSELTLNTIIILLPACLFALSLLSIFINRQNIIRLLLALEMLMLSLNLLVIVLSVLLNKPELLIIVPFLLALAAIEAAVGLGLLVIGYKRKKSLNFEDFKNLKG